MQVMDRRTDVRAPVSLMGAVESPEGEAPAVVVDLSPTGVRLQVDSPPDPEHEYQLHFSVHRISYSARFRVIRWSGGDGAYHWGCEFFDLSDEQCDSLRRSVEAASGTLQTAIKDWDEVVAAASGAPDDQIVVGTTPSGHEITLSGRDCLDVGRDGVELFVKTVAGLENA